MTNRRPLNLLKNIDLLVFLIIASVIFRFSLAYGVTEEFNPKWVNVAALIIVYIGYKFGKSIGLMSGLISTLFCLVIAVLFGESIAFKDLLFSNSIGLENSGFNMNNF
jgi:tetrahydromethanopterin S-methyltransferase subunit G